MKYVMIMVILISIFFIGCPPADNGGEGADFDATQYYTKTEVDALIAENRTAITQASNLIDTTGSDSFTGDRLMPRAGIIKNIYIYTWENSFSGSVTLTFRINDIDTALTFPITTGSGTITYPQNGTLAVAAGDYFDIQYEANVSSGSKVVYIAFEY